jgi:hypothetical protein
MISVIVKTLRIPVGIMAKVEEQRGKTSFNQYCLDALREKAERDAARNASMST